GRAVPCRGADPVAAIDPQGPSARTHEDAVLSPGGARRGAAIRVFPGMERRTAGAVRTALVPGRAEFRGIRARLGAVVFGLGGAGRLSPDAAGTAEADRPHRLAVFHRLPDRLSDRADRR